MKEEFRAIILGGGKGTRLWPYTVCLPKPLVPIGDRPILEIVISQLKDAGVTRVTLAVNHMAELMMAYFGDGSKFGIPIDYSREESPLGTIGPLTLIRDLPDNFLVMNGDTLTDLDYLAFWKGHINSSSLASICAYQRTLTISFGFLDISERGFLSDFREKPDLVHHVSMGVYAFRREVLDYIPVGQPFGFDDLMLLLLKKNVGVRCHVHSGRWLDIGRPDDYERAQNLLTEETTPTVRSKQATTGISFTNKHK